MSSSLYLTGVKPPFVYKITAIHACPVWTAQWELSYIPGKWTSCGDVHAGGCQGVPSVGCRSLSRGDLQQTFSLRRGAVLARDSAESCQCWSTGAGPQRLHRGKGLGASPLRATAGCLYWAGPVPGVIGGRLSCVRTCASVVSILLFQINFRLGISVRIILCLS